MPLSVAVEHIDPGKPSDAAASAVGAAFGQLAPARGVLVGVAGWGDGPAVAVAPWTLEGVRRGAEQYGLRFQATDLAPSDAHSGQRRRLLAAGVVLDDPDGRPLQIELAGARRPRRVPRSWFGRHLCLVVPCAHVRHAKGRTVQWAGPITTAFAALDRACRPAGVRGDAPEAGARLAAQVFASTTLVVDGSWWTSLSEGDSTAPSPLSLDRCFASSSLAPCEGWNREALATLDAWLADELRLTGSSLGRASAVRSRGSAARRPWPRAPRESGNKRGLAGQAVEALWAAHRRRRARLTDHALLPPSIPGPLARWWHDYATSAPPASGR